jgi:hypothetical protein
MAVDVPLAKLDFVALPINHSLVGNLGITLTAPGGATVTLFNRPWSGLATANLALAYPISLIDSASVPAQTVGGCFSSFVVGSPQCPGSAFQPAQLLSTLGMSTAGLWTLATRDYPSLAAGTLVGWSSTFDPVELPVPKVSGSGATAAAFLLFGAAVATARRGQRDGHTIRLGDTHQDA